jgi:hypothetical protein
MKVTPQNQTLLLASDRGSAAGQPVPAAAVPPGTDEHVLKRLTIVAARPDDSMMYVQADYGLKSDSSTPLLVGGGGVARSLPASSSRDESTALPAELAAIPPGLPVRLGANLPVSRSAGMLSAPARRETGSLRGVGLYASTQQMAGGARPGQHLDVRA